MLSLREIRPGVMIFLGKDKWVRSDAIVAVEPIDPSIFFNTTTRYDKIRSRVLIGHSENEIMATRSAKTILRDMTNPPPKPVPFARKADIVIAVEEMNQGDPVVLVDDDKDKIIHSLIHCSTAKDAIEMLPFGATKFYRLVKQYGIDAKAYLAFTDDPESIYDELE